MTDFEDDDVDNSAFVALLVDGSWKIDRFFEETDQTAQFNSYSFTFFADGSAMAVTGTTEIHGYWTIYGDNGELELDLDFAEVSSLDELNEGWQVVSYSEPMITTKDDPDAEQPKELNFKKQ